MKKWITKTRLLQSWDKYGLIVVGNIVFFALLYFISYRPHNSESRAGELLSMAQAQETKVHLESARFLYEKIVQDYADTRSAKTAGLQLEQLIQQQAAMREKDDAKDTISIDVEELLEISPSFYLATLLAEQYDDAGPHKEQLARRIEQYVHMAIRDDDVSVEKIRKKKCFQNEKLSKMVFSLRPACSIKKDWLYDDIFLRNDSIFPWHKVKLKITVKQGDESKVFQRRVARLMPGATTKIAEFRVRDGGGVVYCGGNISAEEGSVAFSDTL